MGYKEDMEEWNRESLVSRIFAMIFIGMICFLVGLYIGVSPMLPLDW